MFSFNLERPTKEQTLGAAHMLDWKDVVKCLHKGKQLRSTTCKNKHTVQSIPGLISWIQKKYYDDGGVFFLQFLIHLGVKFLTFALVKS